MLGSATGQNCVKCPTPDYQLKFQDINCTTWRALSPVLNGSCEPGTYSHYSASTRCDLLRIASAANTGYFVSGTLNAAPNEALDADIQIGLESIDQEAIHADWKLPSGHGDLRASGSGVSAKAEGSVAASKPSTQGIMGLLGNLTLHCEVDSDGIAFDGRLLLHETGETTADVAAADRGLYATLNLGLIPSIRFEYRRPLNLSKVACDIDAIQPLLEGFDRTAYDALASGQRALTCMALAAALTVSSAPFQTVYRAVQPSGSASPPGAAAADAAFHLVRAADAAVAVGRVAADVDGILSRGQPTAASAPPGAGGRRLQQYDDSVGETSPNEPPPKAQIKAPTVTIKQSDGQTTVTTDTNDGLQDQTWIIILFILPFL